MVHGHEIIRLLKVVVLDTFKNASKDEDNILVQNYMKQICLDFYYADLKFFKHYVNIPNFPVLEFGIS